MNTYVITMLHDDSNSHLHHTIISTQGWPLFSCYIMKNHVQRFSLRWSRKSSLGEVQCMPFYPSCCYKSERGYEGKSEDLLSEISLELEKVVHDFLRTGRRWDLSCCLAWTLLEGHRSVFEVDVCDSWAWKGRDEWGWREMAFDIGK